MRQGLVTVLEHDPNVAVVAETGDADTAIGVVERQHLDVVVISHDPPALDGIDLVRKLPRGKGARRVPTVLLVSGEPEEDMLEALKAGVMGLLPRDLAVSSLASAIHDVSIGAMVLATPAAKRLAHRLVRGMPSHSDRRAQSLTTLTGRELEVLVLVAKGLSNRSIATQLCVSEATVKSHLYHLCRKLHIPDRTHAAIIAYETGLIRPSRLMEV
jgi:DNA-binding NarL/FixJ family response regulator